MDPKSLVDIICNDCGCTTQVKYDTWRKKKNETWRCRPCNDVHRKNIHDSKSEEERAEIHRKQSDGIHNTALNRTEEQRARVHEAHVARWARYSEEEMELIKQGRKDEWASRTNEKRNAVIDALQKGRGNYWENMTSGKFTEWDTRRRNGHQRNIDIQPSHPEQQLIDVLKLNNITDYQFQCFNEKIDERFYDLFPENNVIGSKWISPFHQWDFKLHLKNKDVYVDIDGSVHDPTRNNYMVSMTHDRKVLLSDIIEFNDSQRPYQTDGLDMFIIKCYSDNLNDPSTRVYRSSDGMNLPFDTFIGALLYTNMDHSKVINPLEPLKHIN